MAVKHADLNFGGYHVSTDPVLRGQHGTQQVLSDWTMKARDSTNERQTGRSSHLISIFKRGKSFFPTSTNLFLEQDSTKSTND